MLLLIGIIIMRLCNCSQHTTDKCDNNIDTLQLDSQFLKIVKEYVESHPEFDSYLISSQFTVGKYTQNEFDYNCPDRYYISPATDRYCIEFSADSVITFFFMPKELSLNFELNSKKVYINSDVDNLFKRNINIDSLNHEIVVKKPGRIWCFATKNNKYNILSKNVEKDMSYWKGIVGVKSTVKLSSIK